MTEVFLGIDIGGSHIGVGCASAADGNLLCSFSSPVYSYSTFEGLLELIVETVLAMMVKENKDNCSKLDVISIGIGCPGQCKDGILVGACIFRRIPTVLLNDADAAIVAEVWGNDSKDVYRSAKNIAMITIGTGLGVGLVLDGKLYQGSRGLIEGGHIIIDNYSHGRNCSCGQVGCVEAYSSAKSTSIRMFEADVLREREKSKMRKSFSADPNKVTDDVTDDLVTQYDSVEIELGDAADVFVRAGGGEEGAQTIVNETAEGLSILCINLCRILDPEFIILGGGMSMAGDALLDPIKKYFQSRSWTVLNDDVSIVIASNSNNAGILGAALHAMTCYIRRQDDLAFETMILNSRPASPTIVKASKSVEVLNYMHSNRESCSNRNFLDSVHAYSVGDDVINMDGRAVVNGNRYDVHPSTSHPTGKTRAFNSNTDNKTHTHIESQNSINHNSSTRNLSMILLVSGALSLFSAYTFGATVADNRNIIIEHHSNDLKTAHLIHYSAFFCQICAGSYLLYNSQKHAF